MTLRQKPLNFKYVILLENISDDENGKSGHGAHACGGRRIRTGAILSLFLSATECDAGAHGGVDFKREKRMLAGVGAFTYFPIRGKVLFAPLIRGAASARVQLSLST